MCNIIDPIPDGVVQLHLGVNAGINENNISNWCKGVNCAFFPYENIKKYKKLATLAVTFPAMRNMAARVHTQLYLILRSEVTIF